jgi:hypothetical protein
MFSNAQDSYQLVPSLATGRDGKTVTASETLINSRPSQRSHGKPARKPLVNTLDLLAVLLSMVLLGLAICAVTPSLRYASQLQYTRQIIVVGFLLGLMNQCLQRVSPYLFILLETRFGASTLQNYDGLLRWTPFATQLHFIWRALIMVLLLLPLGLGILYKRFIGGVGLADLTHSGGYYAPTAPPGLQNIGALSIMANMTVPFLAASMDDEAVPDLSNGPQAYGFNILTLSNTSAAALDGPVPRQVSFLQQQLAPDSAIYLTADVRGTVAKYNATAETHRNDSAFWDPYYNFTGLDLYSLYNGFYFGFLNIGIGGSSLDPAAWDGSWSFLGAFDIANVNQSDMLSMQNAFQQTALGFNVKRHPCHGTWKITRSSIQLDSGGCDAVPLDFKYQYLEDSELALGQNYLPILGDYLGQFGTTRNESQWLLPTFSVVTAAMYGSRIAKSDGAVPLQAGGPLWTTWNISTQDYNETYFLDNMLTLQVPTLRPAGTLYLILTLQPVLTVAAFVAALALYKVPVGKGFGLVSVLAGVDRESLALLAGATLSGEVDGPVGLRINLKHETEESGERFQRVVYVVGQRGHDGWVKHRNKYH